MGKKRAVVVHGSGIATLSDGKFTNPNNANLPQGTPYNLDDAFQKGAYIEGQPIPLGLHAGTTILLIIEEGDEKK